MVRALSEVSGAWSVALGADGGLAGAPVPASAALRRGTLTIFNDD
jgi:hypothetical protein